MNIILQLLVFYSKFKKIYIFFFVFDDNNNNIILLMVKILYECFDNDLYALSFK